MLKCIERINLRVWIGVVIWLGSFATFLLEFEQPHIYTTNRNNPNPICTSKNNKTSGSLIDNPMRRENDGIQKVLRAAYSIGFIPAALVSGWIVEWYGTRYIVGATMLTGSVCCVCIPFVAGIHWGCTFFLRFLIGINASIYHPAAQHLIAQWSPIEERGRFYATISASSMAIFFIHNFTSLVSFRYGWKIYYFVMGGLASATAALWIWVIEENPADSRRIKEEEKDELVQATSAFINRRPVVPPYLKLIMSVPFWAVLVAHTSYMTGVWSYASIIMVYFTTLLGYTSKTYTLAISVAGVVRFCSSVFFGWTSDVLRKKDIMSLRCVRNLHVLCSMLLYCITTVHCRPIVVISLMYLYGFLIGTVVGGHLQNTMELAPNFVATTYGLMQSVAQLCELIMMIMKEHLTQNRYVEREWNNYIKIWSITYAFSGIFFMAFGAVTIEGLNTKKIKRSAKEYTSRGSILSQPIIRRSVATL